jgi:DNA (cytosine-5)-methyltransferase 1
MWGYGKGEIDMGEMVEQLSLWGEMYPHFHINKKIRTIELFGGVGSQIAACGVLFNYDPTKYEQWKLVEWTYQSYCAYNSMHIKDFNDYANGKSKEEIIERIKGTSTDCETPLSLEQLNKKPMEWLKSAYNNCEATHNLINIMNVSGKDLEINETDKYDYVLFYSFPCQDISMAGKMQGIKEGTRSGLLLEVERILDELKELTDREKENHLPTILVLENVEALCNKIHIKSFQAWQQKLGTLGYRSYCEVLNGIDYGIPQTRKRTFLISILGDYAYDFPRKIKPKYMLKDFLENNVAEKYYLSKEQLERIANWKAQQKPLENIEKHIKNCPTITARGAGEDHSGMILIDENLFGPGEVVDFSSSSDFQREHNAEECPTLTCHSKFGVVELGNYSPSGHNATRVIDPKGNVPTIMGNHCSVYAIPIKNATDKGYLLAEDGDGVDISGRMEYHRGNVQKGKAQTLTTKGGENVGVVVSEESLFSESELALITPDMKIRRYIDSDIVDDFKEGQIATTTYPNGYGHGPRTHDNCITLNTIDKPIVKQKLRIRKLTECECWKLMGFTKTNFKDMERNHFSQSELYRMAGDSIIVCHIVALLSPLIYEQDTHINIINNYVEKIVKGE